MPWIRHDVNTQSVNRLPCRRYRPRGRAQEARTINSSPRKRASGATGLPSSISTMVSTTIRPNSSAGYAHGRQRNAEHAGILYVLVSHDRHVLGNGEPCGKHGFHGPHRYQVVAGDDRRRGRLAAEQFRHLRRAIFLAKRSLDDRRKARPRSRPPARRCGILAPGGVPRRWSGGSRVAIRSCPKPIRYSVEARKLRNGSASTCGA